MSLRISYDRPILPLPKEVLDSVPTLVNIRASYKCPLCAKAMFSYDHINGIERWASSSVKEHFVGDAFKIEVHLRGDIQWLYPDAALRICKCHSCNLSVALLYKSSNFVRTGIIARFDPQELYDALALCNDDLPF